MDAAILRTVLSDGVLSGKQRQETLHPSAGFDMVVMADLYLTPVGAPYYRTVIICGQTLQGTTARLTAALRTTENPGRRRSRSAPFWTR